MKLNEFLTEAIKAAGIEITFNISWKRWDEGSDRFRGSDRDVASIFVPCEEADVKQLIAFIKDEYDQADLESILGDMYYAVENGLNSDERQTIKMSSFKVKPVPMVGKQEEQFKTLVDFFDWVDELAYADSHGTEKMAKKFEDFLKSNTKK